MHPLPYIMLVDAVFYPDISAELVKGATAVLHEHGIPFEHVTVPGALEIPTAIAMAIRSMDFSSLRRRFDGYVVLGCVIRGETSHYDWVCQESFRKINDLCVEYCLALGNGILTCETEEQARRRAAVDQLNKGGHAAKVCLQMLNLKSKFHLFPR